MGSGNMAQKYFAIIKKISPKAEINFYSSRNIHNNFYNKNDEIKKFNPDIVFICSSTHRHFDDLKLINKIINDKFILVEKPLFHKIRKINLKNKVFVGYNLRYDPIINEIKKLIKNKKIWSVEIFCNSFMPRWRKRNYTKTYSAQKKLGGGVALDLSHEIDYLLWFFKNLEIKFSISNKISNLKIDSDDNLVVFGKAKNVNQIILHLNYFSKISARTINITSSKINIRADLIKKKMIIEKNNRETVKSWKEKKFNKTFERQIRSLILEKNILSTSYNEAIDVLNVIKKVKN